MIQVEVPRDCDVLRIELEEAGRVGSEMLEVIMDSST
jgi:hypothetical protein